MSHQNADFKASVLLVEDEAIVAVTLKRALELAGYSVPRVISRGSEAASAVAEHTPDFIVLDVRLADRVTGLEAALRIREISQAPILFVTGYPETEVADAVKSISGSRLLIKPVPPSTVIETIESSLS